MKQTRWIIKDWANNTPFGDMTFDSFEDAWGHVYEYVEEQSPKTEQDYDDYCGEYHVEEVES